MHRRQDRPHPSHGCSPPEVVMPARSEPYDGPAIVTFAKEVEWRRKRAGLSKKELAEKLGFADSYVCHVELRNTLPAEPLSAALETFFKAYGLFSRLSE